MSIGYKTRQREVILKELENFETGVTVKNLLEHLQKKGLEVGQSTLYRRMKKFEEDKVIRSFKINGDIYYELLKKSGCEKHMHLVCNNCHKTIHLDCDSIYEFCDHVYMRHGFKIDKLMTVVYGICEECRNEKI